MPPQGPSETESWRELRRTMFELDDAIARHEQLGWKRTDPPVRALVRRLELARRQVDRWEGSSSARVAGA